MEISDLVWKLFLLLLPGVITTLFVRYISTNKNYPPFYFIIYSAILGLGTFFLLEIIISIYNIIRVVFNEKIEVCWKLNLTIWDSIVNGKADFKKRN